MPLTRVETNAQTGEVTVIELTPEEETALLARREQQRLDHLAARLPRMRVTPRQFRLALNAIGRLDEVEALVTAAPRAVRLAFQYAEAFRRDDQLVAQLASNMSPPLTNAELDNLFIQASQL